MAKGRPAALSLLGILLVGIALRLPALRYDVISDDEAIYEAMARSVARGGVMYHDVVDHKPPGLTYTYAVVRRVVVSLGLGDGRVMAGVHLLGLVVVLATSLALYPIARRLYADGRLSAGDPTTTASWAVLLYVLITACKQPVDALAVNGELLMNLPLALGVWVVLAGNDRPARLRVLYDGAAGALCGVAMLYKYQAGVLGIALPLLVRSRPASPLLRGWLRVFAGRGLCWLAGLGVVLGLVAYGFARRGVLDEALFWGIGFNRSYLQQGPTLHWMLMRLLWQLLGVVLPGLVFYGAALHALVTALGDRGLPWLGPYGLLRVWTLASLGCVALGGRFFGHYFLQPELPLALWAAPHLAAAGRCRCRWKKLGLAVPVLVFWLVSWVPEVNRRFLNAADPDYAMLGQVAARLTTPADTIWVWGNVPQLYHAAARAPGVRFTFCNYLTGLSPGTPSEYDAAVDPTPFLVPQAWPMVFDDLASKKPRVIIDTAAAGIKSYGKLRIERFPALHAYLQAHYQVAATVDGVIYHLRRPEPGDTTASGKDTGP